MASLLDTIRQNSGTLAGQKQGVTDQSQSVATLLRAKSGKAAGGGDIGMSNLGEQQAVANTNTQLQNDIAPQAQVQQQAQATQAAGQEQQLQAQKADIAQTRRFDDLQTKLKVSNTLQDLEQSKGKLSAQDEAAKVQMAAQGLRLQNNTYVQQLQREGQAARLNDINQFNEEMAKATMGDNEELMRTELGNHSIIDVNENDFRKATGQMTAERAYDIFQNAQKAEKERAMYTGISNIVVAGIGAAGSTGGSSSAGTKSNPGGGSLLSTSPASANTAGAAMESA